MKETLKVLNQMQQDGVIGEYAIGGQIAADYYLEPASTIDIDVFVFLPARESQSFSALVQSMIIYIPGDSRVKRNMW